MTSIEWTDVTWNPVTGCSKVSPGCAHCYAERLAPKVFAAQMVEEDVYSPDNSCYVTEQRRRVFTDVRWHKDRLDAPLHWRKPRRVFVNSMSDLFHEDVPDEFLHRVYHVMEHAGQHTFQILTKRAARMRDYLTWRYGPDEEHPRGRIPSRHIWHGVSVENQHFADERIPLLVQAPSAVRFISCEPLLERVDLSEWLKVHEIDLPSGKHWTETMRGAPDLDWIIVGGESGPKSRPFDLAWARLLVAQCRAADVPLFVKQLGRVPFDDGDRIDHDRAEMTNRLILVNRKGVDPDEWPPDLRVREWPEVRA